MVEEGSCGADPRGARSKEPVVVRARPRRDGPVPDEWGPRIGPYQAQRDRNSARPGVVPGQDLPRGPGRARLRRPDRGVGGNRDRRRLGEAARLRDPAAAHPPGRAHRDGPRGARRPPAGLPGRTLLAAAGLFVGVGALALLLSITLAFKGTLLGTALGAFISVQVRGVDYLGVVLAVLLAAISVADVLFLNLRERAPEMVTLRATGWHESHLARMVALEGLGIGLLGSVTGAAAGIGLSALVGGSPGRIVLAGVIAALMGTVVALGASLLPASLVSRMTPPSVLAEE